MRLCLTCDMSLLERAQALSNTFNDSIGAVQRSQQFLLLGLRTRFAESATLGRVDR